jgi:hypothetical protein
MAVKNQLKNDSQNLSSALGLQRHRAATNSALEGVQTQNCKVRPAVFNRPAGCTNFKSPFTKITPFHTSLLTHDAV